MKPFTDIHYVTTKGKIWSAYYKKFLKLSPNEKGYLRLYINTKKGRKIYRVHRLVAKAYIPNPLNLTDVNHKNGDKTDNRIENLEWCTPQENNKHALETGIFIPNRDLSALDRRMIRVLVADGIHITKIARALNKKYYAVRGYIEGKYYKWDPATLEDNRKNRKL